jgi:hypothetical protein
MRYDIPLLLTVVIFMSSSEGCSHPEAHPDEDPTPEVVSVEWFDTVRWKNRLLVFSGEGDDSERQKTLALESRDAYLDRNLLVISLGDDSATVIVGEAGVLPEAELFRQRFAMAAESFEVVLVGKDGGAKERRKAAFDTRELFGIIDAMPMRIREMRR